MKGQLLERANALNNNIKAVKDKLASLNGGCKIHIDCVQRGRIPGLDDRVQEALRKVAVAEYESELKALQIDFDKL